MATARTVLRRTSSAARGSSNISAPYRYPEQQQKRVRARVEFFSSHQEQ